MLSSTIIFLFWESKLTSVWPKTCPQVFRHMTLNQTRRPTRARETGKGRWVAGAKVRREVEGEGPAGQ